MYRLPKVKVNGRPLPLPVRFGSTAVWRQGKRVTVENSEGLRVECGSVHGVCGFTLSGWYFGKTGGLLGVYDNEASNDWMDPDRDVLDDPEAFLAAWAVDGRDGGGCDAGAGGFAAARVAPTAREASDCEALFASDLSSLMPCFGAVDPAPFAAL